MRVSVYRKEHFNAAHRLQSTQLSQEENQAVFGKCNNPNFHGHNYELVVRITGEIDPVTGYVIDMKVLSQIIKEKILHKFDHKNLNLDTEAFKDVNPTAENIAVVIWEILRKELKNDYTIKVWLYETERNFVEYPAAD
jgi:6-pyruvoyltetrahydropterin/6-carboxytetrahydropterin synthase